MEVPQSLDEKPTVHLIWLGSPLPDRYKNNVQSWRDKGYDVWLWKGPLDDMVNRKLFDAARSFALKADILRLEILERYGGIYSDMDSWMVEDFPVVGDLIGMYSANNFVANETIYCAKGHPALKEAVDRMQPHFDSLRGKLCNIWDIAGATYITPIFRRHIITMLPKQMVGKQAYKPSVIAHSYDGSWAKGVPKSAKMPLEFWVRTDKLNAAMAK